MNDFENKNDFRQKDEKGLVIAAVIACLVLFAGAIGLFMYSYYGFKEKRADSVEENKKNSMTNSVAEQSEENENELEETENDDNDVYEENNSEKKNNATVKTEIKEVDDNQLNEEELKAKNTIINFLNAVKNRNLEEACKYSDNNECSIIDIVNKQLNTQDDSIVQYNMFFEKMMDYDYVIQNINAEGNEAEATVYIETYNFTTTVLDARLHVTDQQVAYSFGNSPLSDEDKKSIAQGEVKIILDDMDRKLKIPVTITLVSQDGMWKIKSESIDNELKNAVMKNLYDSIQAYYDFYLAINNKEINELSVDSFIKYLASKGVYYDEDGELSPFDN